MIKVQMFEVPFYIVNGGEKRLDASFYAQDVINARIVIDKLRRKDIKVDEIGDLSNRIFWPGRFKRNYVSKKIGSPFLTPNDVFMFLPEARKFVRDFPEEALVEAEWLLITRSGNIGRCLVSTKLLKTFILSDDLIRIVPKSKDSIWYLYAYLNTWIGQAFLTKDQYGATVKHIEPHHVSIIPIPIFPELQDEITRNISQVHRLREEAQEGLLKAQEMIYSELGLPKIDEEDIEYFGGEKGKIVRCFGIKASELNLRFDASYHIPILRKIKKNLLESKFRDTRFGEVIDKIFIPPRFKRPYVKDQNLGVPFLQGSHIPQIKPMNVKYLWKRTKNLKNSLIEKDWLLMTRSGTVGKMGIVRDGLDNWAASEHILRIIIKPEIHPGYVAAFLASLYGDYQIKGKTYGAVVDEIGERDTSLIEEIDMILAPKDAQNLIGNLVFEAFDKRDEANRIEEKTIKLLEEKIEEIAEG